MTQQLELKSPPENSMTELENYRRTLRFQSPDFLPVHVVINTACWHHYPPDDIRRLMAAHPHLFPAGPPDTPPPIPEFARAGHPWRDPWNCIWETTDDGIMGAVTHHPLAQWDAFETWTPPDPEKTTGMMPVDWPQTEAQLNTLKQQGKKRAAGLRHGHTFLALQDLRGYQNLLFDMVDQEPRLPRLIQQVENFNLAVIRRFLALGVDLLSYPEDLGMRQGPMLSPEQFRRFIKPSYQRLMQPARDAGCLIHMHSDGDIRALLPDLLDCGIDCINLQDLVNGIDFIADNLAGNVCVDLDIDRQQITRFGSPAEITAHLRTIMQQLGSRRGGLMFTYGWYPGIPLENMAALLDALESCSTTFSC